MNVQGVFFLGLSSGPWGGGQRLILIRKGGILCEFECPGVKVLPIRHSGGCVTLVGGFSINNVVVISCRGSWLGWASTHIASIFILIIPTLKLVLCVLLVIYFPLMKTAQHGSRNCRQEY